MYRSRSVGNYSPRRKAGEAKGEVEGAPPAAAVEGGASEDVSPRVLAKTLSSRLRHRCATALAEEPACGPCRWDCCRCSLALSAARIAFPVPCRGYLAHRRGPDRSRPGRRPVASSTRRRPGERPRRPCSQRPPERSGQAAPTERPLAWSEMSARNPPGKPLLQRWRRRKRSDVPPVTR